MAKYNNIYEILMRMSDNLRPPERLSVSDSASMYRYVNSPGSYVGPWLNTTTPYMVEPMDALTSRRHSKMAFVGPAQSGKTDAIIINGVAYSIKVSPMDTMIYCPTMSAARDFSMRRIDRLHRHSPEIGDQLLKGRDTDNKFDKHYVTGMMLTITYPTVTELAGRPVPRILMTDFDRMDDDIGGDGNPFDLATQRTTTFGSFAMTMAESSPSREILDPQWIARTPHEAPPCNGIIALYNRGDRRRWYWPCPHCGEFFEGKFEHLTWNNDKGLSNREKSETVEMMCPECGCLIHPDERYEMNIFGVWVPEGCKPDTSGRLVGKPPHTDFVSYWLRGTAAAFTTWQKLVNIYLDALDDYKRTFSEESLKKFWNNNMGEPYQPKSLESVRSPEALKSRAGNYPLGFVPEDVRFLVATIDVQLNSFVVQVFGVSPGDPYDTHVIDRFFIQKSERLDADGDPMILQPATYEEDWHLIESMVIDKEYPLNDGSGRLMSIKMTGCDSGGKAGVTTMAYAFYRHLREKNKHARFTLIKGENKPSSPRTRITYPDSNRKGKKHEARGEIPVLFLNSNLIKDSLNGRLDCVEPGKGYYNMTRDLPNEFFTELCSETRTVKGWENLAQSRNEAWDLSYYLLGICTSPQLLRVEHINWNSPPTWAEEWDHNDMIRTPIEEKPFALKPKDVIDYRRLGELLG